MRNSPELSRDLGAKHATAIVIGTIIGSGIFLVPAEMTQAVGSSKLVFLAWIVGGLLSFFGALTYAELGAMRPEAGGEYVYVRDAYGPLPAFLYGWTWFVIAKPASIASVTMGIVRVLGTFPALAFFSDTHSSFKNYLRPVSRYRRDDLHLFSQLHRNQKGWRLSAVFYRIENRHCARHRRGWVQL